MDKYYPYNAVNGDRTHDADDLAKIIQAMITDGVELITGEMMQVTEATGFDVTVKPGTCIVQGRIGIIESNKTLSVPAPSSALDRIDIVAARADYTERMTKLVYLTGTPASTPTAPALKNDVYGYDIPLAEIRVNKNATKITQANITDRREACSFIIPKNADAFFAQLRTAFDEWFADVQDTLDSNQAGNLLGKINGLQVVCDQIKTDVAKKVQCVLYYTNASPTSEFGAWKPGMNLDGYTSVLIEYFVNAATLGYRPRLLVPIGGEALAVGLLNTGRQASRHATAASDGVLFGDCYLRDYNTAGAGTVDNTYMVPYRTWAVKGV